MSETPTPRTDAQPQVFVDNMNGWDCYAVKADHARTLERELTAARAELAALRAAIQNEPELPGDMPDAVWIALQGFSRAQMQAFLKGSVKRIKANILARAKQ